MLPRSLYPAVTSVIAVMLPHNSVNLLCVNDRPLSSEERSEKKFGILEFCIFVIMENKGMW
jgi:hypothetical protein